MKTQIKTNQYQKIVIKGSVSKTKYGTQLACSVNFLIDSEKITIKSNIQIWLKILLKSFLT